LSQGSDVPDEVSENDEASELDEHIEADREHWDYAEDNESYSDFET